MKEELKSEFASKMEEIAKQVTALVENDPKKSVIIIATESDNEGTGAVIAVAGRGGELAKGIAEFATNNESRDLFAHGLRLAQLKISANAVESMFEELLKK